MPQFERPPRPPVLHREEPHVPDPIQAVLGEQPFVPAESEDPEALMPWYLKRRTLVALALLAVVLIAMVVSLS